MVGCEDKSAPVQAELFDITDYPERWSFSTYRQKGNLVSTGIGMYAHTHNTIFEVRLEYQDKKWVLVHMQAYDDEKAPVPYQAREEMFKEFAFHKAYYLKKKESRSSTGMKRTKRRGW
jgi:hypothetical protein